MDLFQRTLNEMLSTAYRSVNKVEECMLRRLSDGRLSLSEMRMLESIGKRKNEGMTITEIAQDLEITPPSVTAMIKRLEQKGYIVKDRSRQDGRCVHVLLTREGERAEIAHRYFHRKMVYAITANLSQQEQDAIMTGLGRMNDFMRRQLDMWSEGKEGNA